MSAPRPLPWTALLEALGASRFEDIRAALARSATDPLDRDAFLLDGAVGRLLRELVPEDAPAEAVTSYGALLHALYLHWAQGSPVRTLEREVATALLSSPRDALASGSGPDAVYVRLPERLVWASPASGAAHEPMDGLFVLRRGARGRALAVLGFRPDRQGFTTIEAELPLVGPGPEPRPDGTTPFATVLPGGERMGFFSVTTPAELGALALLALASSRG
jgi:hypothetical protein